MSYAGTIMREAYASGRIGRDPTRGPRPLRQSRRDVGSGDARAGADRRRGRAPPSSTQRRRGLRAAIALGANGLRVEEVLGLSADRLDLERRRVTIDQQVQRVGSELVMLTPKAEKVRTIGLPSRMCALELRRHLREFQGGGILFRGGREAPMLRRDEFYKQAWRPALVGAGFEPDRFKFHSLRHYCASSLLPTRLGLAGTAAHLGDTPETVMRTYAHWLRDQEEFRPGRARSGVPTDPRTTAGGSAVSDPRMEGSWKVRCSGPLR